MRHLGRMWLRVRSDDVYRSLAMRWGVAVHRSGCMYWGHSVSGSASMVPAHLSWRRNNWRRQARTLVVLGGVLPLYLGLVAGGVFSRKRGRACSEYRWFCLIVLMVLIHVMGGRRPLVLVVVLVLWDLHVVRGSGAVVCAIPNRRLITHTKQVHIATMPLPVSVVMPRCG